MFTCTLDAKLRLGMNCQRCSVYHTFTMQALRIKATFTCIKNMCALQVFTCMTSIPVLLYSNLNLNYFMACKKCLKITPKKKSRQQQQNHSATGLYFYETQKLSIIIHLTSLPVLFYQQVWNVNRNNEIGISSFFLFLFICKSVLMGCTLDYTWTSQLNCNRDIYDQDQICIKYGGNWKPVINLRSSTGVVCSSVCKHIHKYT